LKVQVAAVRLPVRGNDASLPVGFASDSDTAAWGPGARGGGFREERLGSESGKDSMLARGIEYNLGG
jgi:hypothetical protein